MRHNVEGDRELAIAEPRDMQAIVGMGDYYDQTFMFLAIKVEYLARLPQEFWCEDSAWLERV